MIGAGEAAGLAAAGVLAGAVGTAGAITSLVSYPALLAVGLPALVANVSNNVALVVCWPGSAFASRPELRGRARWLGRWAPISALGGGVGAALLLSTPAHAFALVVPFLVLGASLVLVLQPHLRRRRRVGAGEPEHRVMLTVGLLALSLYNGYFGAGSGVMVLTLLLVAHEPRLASANALKNALIGAATVVSAAIYALSGPVDWTATAPLAAGMLVGSTIGPQLTRRLPPALVRTTVALAGVALALQLWFAR